MPEFVEDPVKRFQAVLTAVSGPNPGLSEAALQTAIAREPDDDARAAAAARLVAANSTLTETQAKAVVAPSIKAAPAGQKAKAASQAATEAAASATADVELSDPVMLKAGWRVVFAVAQAVIIAAAAVLLAFKGMSNDRAIGLAVIAILNSIGLLVLVMGYKNVKITASPPAKSGS